MTLPRRSLLILKLLIIAILKSLSLNRLVLKLFKDWQEGCSSLHRLKKIILSNPGNINEIKKACNKFKALQKYSRYVDSIWVNSEGLLIFDSSFGSESNFSYLVPFLVLGEIVQASHERNGHIGYDKLLYRVKYYFSSNFVRGCF